jgi:hypothetical protein
MDNMGRLLITWLEEEGARQRRRLALPPRVEDPTVRGWVHVGVCLLVGTIAAGLFLCWIGPTRSVVDRIRLDLPVERSVTLNGVRVTGVLREVKADDGTGFLTLLGNYRGVPVVCKFRHAPYGPWRGRAVQAGDIVDIRSNAGRDERETSGILLRDCEVIRWSVLPDE